MAWFQRILVDLKRCLLTRDLILASEPAQPAPYTVVGSTGHRSFHEPEQGRTGAEAQACWADLVNLKHGVHSTTTIHLKVRWPAEKKIPPGMWTRLADRAQSLFGVSSLPLTEPPANQSRISSTQRPNSANPSGHGWRASSHHPCYIHPMPAPGGT